MTGTIKDTNPRPRTRDIGPDEEREYLLEQPFINRATLLEDDRKNLNERLERYVKNRTFDHRLPPKHPSYNPINARLKFSTDGRKGGHTDT